MALFVLVFITQPANLALLPPCFFCMQIIKREEMQEGRRQLTESEERTS